MNSLYRLQKKGLYFAARLLPALRLFLRNYARTHRLFRAKKKGRYAYTVVTHVRNNERRLDSYFRSLTGQVLDFRNNITLILVDDGSTDASASIIKNWQSRYPENIRYIYQEEQGRAPALDAGLSQVKTPWVAFVDPDDFVDATYFSHIDDILTRSGREKAKNGPVRMLVCAQTLYDEKANHVLRYKGPVPGSVSLLKKTEELRLDANMAPIPVTVRATLYNTSVPTDGALCFEKSPLQKAEDLLFTVRYLQSLHGGDIIFSSLPRYYRNTSQSQTPGEEAAQSGQRLPKALEECCARLLALSSQKGGALKDGACVYPPVRSALFALLSEYIVALYNTPPQKSLEPGLTEQLFALLREYFQCITPEAVESMGALTAGFETAHTAAVLALFKNQELERQTIFVTRYDFRKQQICLVYYCKAVQAEEVRLSGVAARILYGKSTLNSLGQHPCSLRRQLWVRLSAPGQVIEVFIAGKRADFEIDGKRLPAATVKEALAPFGGSLTCPLAAHGKAPWVFMDRPAQADDNAEHLYRYVRKAMPAQQIFYALQKDSPDWDRLATEGFNLVEPGSRAFDAVLRKADTLLASHFTLFMYAKNLCTINAIAKKYIWLQHGVMENDLSAWLNEIDLDVIVSSTLGEYHSIADDLTPYNASQKDVKPAGLPRHDALVPHMKTHKNTLFVMPTWRRYLQQLARNYTGDALQEKFLASTYGAMWKKLLLSEELERIQKTYAMRILFYPHADLRPFLSCFSLPGHIAVAQPGHGSIQQFLQEAVVLITDFSSIAFEMAFMKKAVLYYQFDPEDFFSKHWKKGYFDYTRDGFGPVCDNPENLLHNLDVLLQRGAVPESVYQKRMEEAFPFRDGRNCERVCRAVVEAHAPC